MARRIDSDKVKAEIKALAERMASGGWGAWECSLGGLVALIELVNRLHEELGEDFWSEIYTIKSEYQNKLRSLGVGQGSPNDFFKR